LEVAARFWIVGLGIIHFLHLNVRIIGQGAEAADEGGLLTVSSTRLTSILTARKAKCRLLVPEIRSSAVFTAGDLNQSERESSHISRSVRICLTFLVVSRA
jgi:hypothetical protein